MPVRPPLGRCLLPVAGLLLAGVSPWADASGSESSSPVVHRARKAGERPLGRNAAPRAVSSPAASPSPRASSWPEPPPIATLVLPKVLKAAVEDREVQVNAKLEDVPSAGHDETKLRPYRFYSLVLIRASLERTRSVLTDYPLYARLVPFVEKAVPSEDGRTIELQGGVLGWKMRSIVQFEERGARALGYRIVAGAFAGMEGQAIFESRGEKGTLVHFSGSTVGSEFPPKFILERGAEIVFGFTGRRMRSYIESREDEKEAAKASAGSPTAGSENPNADPIPEPRSGPLQPR